MLSRLLAALLLAAALGSTARANLIVNGSFETGTLPTLAYATLAAASSNITGWTIGGHGIDYIGTYWQAADGSRSVDLDSGTAVGTGPYDGTLAQTFATNAGGHYLLNFQMAGNPDGAPAVKLLNVSAAGQSAQFSFTNSTQTRASMGYQPRSFSFTATSASTTLTFTSLSGSGFGPVLDNINVTAVPESAVLLLGLSGLSALRRPLKRA